MIFGVKKIVVLRRVQPVETTDEKARVFIGGMRKRIVSRADRTQRQSSEDLSRRPGVPVE
jgi:hypothetical protein